MVEGRKDADKGTGADNAADLSRFAEATAGLIAQQTAAMAVMTVYGIRAASEMTSMMLGALRGSASQSPASGTAEREAVPAVKAVPVGAKIVPLRQRTPEPVAAQSAEAKPSVRMPATKSRKAVLPKASGDVEAPKRAAARKAKVAGSAVMVDRDDLKKISGIGPRLEQVLNERGIVRFADLAALSKDSLARLDVELDLEGRATRDDWAGQARALSRGRG